MRILAIIIGVTAGIGLGIGFYRYSLLIPTLATSSVSLASIVTYYEIKKRRILARYRRQEEKNLIEP